MNRFTFLLVVIAVVQAPLVACTKQTPQREAKQIMLPCLRKPGNELLPLAQARPIDRKAIAAKSQEILNTCGSARTQLVRLEAPGSCLAVVDYVKQNILAIKAKADADPPVTGSALTAETYNRCLNWLKSGPEGA